MVKILRRIFGNLLFFNNIYIDFSIFAIELEKWNKWLIIKKLRLP